MPMVPTPVPMLFASKYAPVVSWYLFYDWLTEKEKARAWFTDGSAHSLGITQKWTI